MSILEVTPAQYELPAQNLPCIHVDLMMRILAFLPTSLVRKVFTDESGTWAKSIIEGPGFQQLQVVQLLSASNDFGESYVKFTLDSCIIFYDTTSRINSLVYLTDLQKWFTMDIYMVINILRMQDVQTHYRILDASKQCLLLGLNVNQDIVFGLQVVNPVTKEAFYVLDIGYVLAFSKIFWCSSTFIRLLVDDNDDFCVIAIATDHSDSYSNRIFACYSSRSNMWKRIRGESIPTTIFAFERCVQDLKLRILSFATSAKAMIVNNSRLDTEVFLDEAERQNLKTIHHYVTVVSRNCTYLTGIFEFHLCIFDQWCDGKLLLPEDYISTNDVDGRFYCLRKLATAPVDINTYSRWRVVGHKDRIFFFLCNDREDVEVIFYSTSHDTWERQAPLWHKPNVYFATWKGLRVATFTLLH